MSTNEQSSTGMTLPSAREIRFTRTFDAPRELVWQMWTQAEHLRKWWGPQGWTVPVCEVDLRPEGTWHYCMAGPDNMESWGLAVYHEIVAPERLVYTDYFSDAEGNRLDTLPSGHVTVEFSEQDGRTWMVNTTSYPTQADRDKVLEMGVEPGMNDTLDRLVAALADAQNAGN